MRNKLTTAAAALLLAAAATTAQQVATSSAAGKADIDGLRPCNASTDAHCLVLTGAFLGGGNYQAAYGTKVTSVRIRWRASATAQWQPLQTKYQEPAMPAGCFDISQSAAEQGRSGYGSVSISTEVSPTASIYAHFDDVEIPVGATVQIDQYSHEQEPSVPGTSCENIAFTTSINVYSYAQTNPRYILVHLTDYNLCKRPDDPDAGGSC